MEWTVEPINFSVVRMEPMFNETVLSSATGFFYAGTLNSARNFWLITNWHVLSGRNASVPTKVEHTQGGLPNRVRLRIPSKVGDDGQQHENRIYFWEHIIELYDHVKRPPN